MKKRYLLLLVICFVVLLFALVANNNIQPCEHCNKITETANRLLGNVDMQICEDCYSTFVNGEWGSEFR